VGLALGFTPLYLGLTPFRPSSVFSAGLGKVGRLVRRGTLGRNRNRDCWRL